MLERARTTKTVRARITETKGHFVSTLVLLLQIVEEQLNLCVNRWTTVAMCLFPRRIIQLWVVLLCFSPQKNWTTYLLLEQRCVLGKLKTHHPALVFFLFSFIICLNCYILCFHSKNTASLAKRTEQGHVFKASLLVLKILCRFPLSVLVHLFCHNRRSGRMLLVLQIRASTQRGVVLSSVKLSGECTSNIKQRIRAKWRKCEAIFNHRNLVAVTLPTLLGVESPICEKGMTEFRMSFPLEQHPTLSISQVTEIGVFDFFPPTP